MTNPPLDTVEARLLAFNLFFIKADFSCMKQLGTTLYMFRMLPKDV